MTEEGRVLRLAVLQFGVAAIPRRGAAGICGGETVSSHLGLRIWPRQRRVCEQTGWNQTALDRQFPSVCGYPCLVERTRSVGDPARSRARSSRWCRSPSSSSTVSHLSSYSGVALLALLRPDIAGSRWRADQFAGGVVLGREISVSWGRQQSTPPARGCTTEASAQQRPALKSSYPGWFESMYLPNPACTQTLHIAPTGQPDSMA